MRTFQCHKRVKAAQIVEIVQGGDGSPGGSCKTILHLEDDRTADKPTGTNHVPVIGDYLVEYEDGYRSISPRGPFEAGYTELPSEEELVQAVTFTVQPHVGKDAIVRPLVDNGAIVGVLVVTAGLQFSEATSEPLTDTLACLMFGVRAGIDIAGKMERV